MTDRPLLVGVAELCRRPGNQRAVDVEAALAGLAVSGSEVPADGAVRVELELEAITDGVTAEGRVSAPWVGSCRRCLEPVGGEVVAEVREIFERRPVEGETYPLGDGELDLEPMVRDAVLLALPLAPLCRADCPGPAPESFPTGSAATDEETRPPDPRWAALDELRFDTAADAEG